MFMAGANSIFTGDRLLTTSNPEFDADKVMMNAGFLASSVLFCVGGDRCCSDSNVVARLCDFFKSRGVVSISSDVGATVRPPHFLVRPTCRPACANFCRAMFVETPGALR